MAIPYLGYQKTIDFYGCTASIINSVIQIEESLIKAAQLMQLSIVNVTIHEFAPIGVSGVVVIEESHIAIHTWPEHHYVAIDIFTCNDAYELEEGIKFLKEIFKAQEIVVKDMVRGDLQKINALTSSIHKS